MVINGVRSPLAKEMEGDAVPKKTTKIDNGLQLRVIPQ